jgi:polygalacturonase
MNKLAIFLLVTLLFAPLAGLHSNPVTNGVFNVRQYGAVGDGKTLDTAAIQEAIRVASTVGGGTVVFPPGTYLSSSIRLLSHVTLHIEKGATLLGSPVHTGYQKAHFYALMVAEGQTNIGIRGQRRKQVSS